MTMYKGRAIERRNRPSITRRVLGYGAGLLALGLAAGYVMSNESARNKVRQASSDFASGLNYTTNAVAGGLAAFIPATPDNMFADGRWHRVRYPQQTSIWGYYMGEHVDHNTDLWNRYLFEVDKHNRECGNPLDSRYRPPGWNTIEPAHIWLSDLDGDGKVGEAEMTERK